jgi:putative ABC transport system substrate-binding protein
MNKRDSAIAFLAFCTVVFATPYSVFAQNPNRMIRLGVLVAGTLEQRGGLDRALVEGLRARGYVEGNNLVIERRYGHETSNHGMTDHRMGDYSMTGQLPKLARELADMKLDAIVTTCAPSTHAAKNATSSTPIIMASVSDPVGQGLVASLAKPERNITGLSSQADELLPKRLQLVASLLSPNTLVMVLANSRNAVHPPMWQKLKGTAQKLKIRLMLVETDDGAGLPAAFDAAIRARAEALFVLPDDPMIFNFRDRIVAFAAKHRMPDIYWASEFVEAGGLLSYGANLRDNYLDATIYIDKVVKGAKPATLPVAQPTRFELVVNRKTAKNLGLTIPPSMLLRADRVIE